MQKRDNKGRFTGGQQTVKGYKGFHAGMVCRGKQYNENTVERVEGAPVLCENGIHFCENPFDVLNYYPLVDDYGMPNEFAEVEALGSCVSDGVKTATNHIRIGKKLGLSGFCHASCEYLERLCVAGDDTTGSNRQSQSGYGSRQSQSGDYSQQSQSGYGSPRAVTAVSSPRVGITVGSPRVGITVSSPRAVTAVGRQRLATPVLP